MQKANTAANFGTAAIRLAPAMRLEGRSGRAKLRLSRGFPGGPARQRNAHKFSLGSLYRARLKRSRHFLSYDVKCPPIRGGALWAVRPGAERIRNQSGTEHAWALSHFRFDILQYMLTIDFTEHNQIYY
jgi:hypothetical protein